MSGKVLCKEAIDFWKVRNIGHKYGRVSNQIEAAPSCLQDRFEISKCLPGLRFKTCSRGLACGGIDAGLTGHKQQTSLGTHRLRVRTNGFQIWNLDTLLAGNGLASSIFREF
jgi:hypothetical protein